MSFGIVVPGVSSTVILMSFGVYPIYLEAVSNLNFAVLFPMGIGILLGCLLFLKFIQICLQKYFVPTFYCIIGFVLGSVLVLYPGFSFQLEGFLSIFLSVICFLIGLKFAKLDTDN